MGLADPLSLSVNIKTFIPCVLIFGALLGIAYLPYRVLSEPALSASRDCSVVIQYAADGKVVNLWVLPAGTGVTIGGFSACFTAADNTRVEVGRAGVVILSELTAQEARTHHEYHALTADRPYEELYRVRAGGK